MYINKEERKSLLESKNLQEQTNKKYDELDAKLSLIMEALGLNKKLEEDATTEQEDDITVEVDGEVVVDTTDDAVVDDTIIEEPAPEADEPTDAVDQVGPEHAVNGLLIGAIKDEYEAIEFYNDMIANIQDMQIDGAEDMIRVLKHINEEELIHVGMLQQLMTKLSPAAESIDSGKAEVEEIVSAASDEVTEE